MKLRLSGFVVVVACVALGGGSVSAQDTPLGSRLPGSQGMKSERARIHSVQQGHLFASCTVHKRGSLAARYLNESDPVAADRDSVLLSRELECASFTATSDFSVGSRLNSSTDIYRGNLAEALLDRIKPFPKLPAMPLEKQYQAPLVAVSGRDPVVEEMAVCVAAVNPDGIVSLIATDPETDAEKARIQQILPWVGKCLVATARLTANRQSMRAALAEALYHRANLAVSGASDRPVATPAPRN